MRSKSRKNQAFTLIELLIVITVIMILAGILILGAKHITGSSKMRQTKVMMESLSGMLTNLDAATKLRGQPGGWVWARPTNPNILYPAFNGLELDFWRVPYRKGTGTPVVTDPADSLDGPGPVTDAGTDADRRNGDPAILNTTVAQGMILALPVNRDVVGKMQPNQLFTPTTSAASKYPPGAHLMVNAGGTKTYYVCTPANVTAGASNGPPGSDWTQESRSFPLLLDGWGNPIIFVPAGGLTVYLSADQTRSFVVKSPDNRPFWASAGPDGTFGFRDTNGNNTFEQNVDVPAGDDNVYSFEK